MSWLFKSSGGSKDRGKDESAPPTKAKAGGERKNDSVFVLHDPGRHVPGWKPDVELVFIHGLRFTGERDIAYWTTWLARDGTESTCWPAEWLQHTDDFPVNARVVSLNYDSSVKKSATEGRFDLELLGESLLQQMYLLDAKVGQNNCPVVFVCHSFGGIVAKEIVLTAKTTFYQNEQAQNLLRNLKGFFFYSTPHCGTKLFQKLCKVSSAQQAPLYNSVKELETKTARLNSSFQRLKNSPEYKHTWRFKGLVESCATTVHGKEYDSLKYATGKYIGIDDFLAIPSTDHFTVCQPESKDDDSVKHLKDFVLRITDPESLQ